MLKKVKEYFISKKRFVVYPPILDRNPEFAAKFLLKRELVTCYRTLKSAFIEISEGRKDSEVLIDTIMDSKDNFLWYIKFFHKISEIIKKPKMRVNMDKCPLNSGFAPNVQQPFRIGWTYKKDGKYVLELRYLKDNVKTQDPINNYRMLYIREGYNLDEFQDNTFPAWYLLKNTTIFEQYNQKTNRRVRIDFRNGEFYYFIAGASDNWQLIKDVPKEMDDVVSALIFRNNLD